MLMTIEGKVGDLFTLTLGENYQTDYEFQGYVPDGLNIGSGDYIQVTIDLETGMIDNWKPLTVEDVKAACGEEEDEDEDIHIPTDAELLAEALSQLAWAVKMGVVEHGRIAFDASDIMARYRGWWIRHLSTGQFHITEGDDPRDPDGMNGNEEWHSTLTSALHSIHAQV